MNTALVPDPKRHQQHHNNYLNKNYCVIIMDYLLINILFFLQFIQKVSRKKPIFEVVGSVLVKVIELFL
jgi:hypothetical protein